MNDPRDVLYAHHQRLTRAIGELENLLEQSTASEHDRLRGKIEGVRLALLYLDDSLRWMDRADV